jgi:hypothetical protein
MWDTFALATVLTLKVGPGAPPLIKGDVQSVQPQVSTDLGYCNFFNPFLISMALVYNAGKLKFGAEKKTKKTTFLNNWDTLELAANGPREHI